MIPTLCMIHKLNTDDFYWKNFRPILLFNIDVKLLAEILASRLNTCIGHPFHKDQVVFMHLSQAGDNIHRIILMIEVPQKHNIPFTICYK